MSKIENKSFESSIAFDRGNLILAIISLLIGGYLGQLIPPLIKDPTDPTYWPLWLLVATSVLLVTGIGSFIIMASRFKLESKSTITKTFELFELVEETVSRQAALIPRNIIYKEMATAFNEAKSSISVVTLLTVDWEKKERNWQPALTTTPFRDEFYNAIKLAIEREDIVYERIWQVPSNRASDALDLLFTDSVHKEEFELIKKCSEANPHLAKFMIASTITTASFILIDDKKLFFNIDIYNEESRKMESPYMLFIKDAKGDVFKPLRGVIARFKPLNTDKPTTK
jgi:hypothetical protein